MKVFFYDHSALKRTGAKWQWEFPGSIQGSSTEENPIIDYEAAKPGKYSVKLTVTDGKGIFRYVPQQQSGFHLQGDVRSIVAAGNQLFFGINGSAVKAYKIQE